MARDLGALDAAEPYDVCIVGSGPAGTVLGTQLVEAGLKVLMLESGGSIFDWLRDKRLKQLASYEFTGDTNYPLTRTSTRVVGGNSNFWTGRADRFHPSDFEQHPYTPPDNPWPFRYADIESYYDRAERTLRVRGGPYSEHMPPRAAPLELPPSPDISDLKELMHPAGMVIDDSPTATPRKALRFFRVNKEILPRFLASGRGTLVSGVVVTRLEHDAQGRIVGARCRTFDGAEKVARARTYVVACGGIQTPRLLLLSKSAIFPNGIGNRYDKVGRFFNEHPAPDIYTRIPHSRLTIVPRHKIGRTHQYYERFRGEGLGSIVPVIIQSIAFPHHLVRYKLIDVPREALKMVKRLVKAELYMGCICEQRPVESNRVTLSGSRRDMFGDPLAHLMFNYHADDLRLIDRSRQLLNELFDRVGATDREEIEITWSRHHQGTCRMGTDPRTSVCDPDLRVHDCPNLYLSGCETFVTGSAVPPTLTIVALAHRLGDHLLARGRQELPGTGAGRVIAGAALRPRFVVGRLLGSATVQMSMLYATAGVVYTIANLMLARVLSIPEFASVTLILAIIGFGGIVAPMGQERAVVRHHLPATPSLLAHGLASATTVALLVASVSFWLYGLGFVTCAILVLAIAGQGTAILASSRLQSERRFFTATLITQASSPLLFTAALLVIGTGQGGSHEVAAVFAIGLALVSAVSWWRLFIEAEPASPYRIDWSEALALTGISAMSALAGALDRLIVPLILDHTDLAQFGVLAALVIAPMRVLQMAVQRSLMPRLRDATSARARRRLMLREAGVTGALVAAVCLAVWFLAPFAVGIIVGDKYDLPPDLLLAGIVSGAVRVVVGFSMAAVTALSSRDRLHLVNASGWLTLLLAIPAAWLGARFGHLAGLVLGLGCVWLLQAAVLASFVQHKFRGP